MRLQEIEYPKSTHLNKLGLLSLLKEKVRVKKFKADQETQWCHQRFRLLSFPSAIFGELAHHFMFTEWLLWLQITFIFKVEGHHTNHTCSFMSKTKAFLETIPGRVTLKLDHMTLARARKRKAVSVWFFRFCRERQKGRRKCAENSSENPTPVLVKNEKH